MRRFAVFASLLLAGLLTGCTSEVDMANLRDNTLHSTQLRSDQVTTVQERVAQLEKAEADRQRSLIRMTAALDELRLGQRKLRGELEELQYRQEQVSTNLEDKLAALDQRFYDLENRLGAGGVLVPGQLDPGSGPLPSLPESGFEAEPTAPPTSGMEPVTEPPPAPGEPEVVIEPPQPAPEDDAVAERLFQRARDDFQQGNYEVAIILYKQYLRQYPQSSRAGDAQYWVGESLYAQKEYNAAIVAFDEVIQQYPQNEVVAAATLKVGLSFANLDDKPNARFFLQQVQEKFSNSAEAQLATEKLKQLRR